MTETPGNAVPTVDPAGSERDWFLVSLLVAELFLIASTWPLWFGNKMFPTVPLAGGLSRIPPALDAVFATLLVTILLFRIGVLLRGGTCRPEVSTVICVIAVLLILLNQHRLQPWHWLFILLSSQMIFVDKWCRRPLRRITIASIYIFAGLSRFGSDVNTGAGRQLLTLFTEQLNLAHLLRNENAVFLLCTLMTALELAAGVGLLFRGTRKTATIAAMAMHLLLLYALGPWGLNHHTGVLVWNFFFVVALPLLFLRGQPDDSRESGRRALRTSGVAVMSAGFVILFPLCGLFGITDSWPSWQLYSPRPDVVRLSVKESDVPLLPGTLRKFVGQPAPLDDWCPVRLDRWSLASTNAPLYPEGRFQLAIVQQVCAEAGLTDVRVTLESAPLLYWQGRQWSELQGIDAVRRKAEEYYLNGVSVRR